MSVTPAQFDAAANMQELYDLLSQCGIENGWNKPEPSLWPLPRKDFLPAHWSYGIGKAALNAAGRFVDTELAERRNLILANPVAGNKYPTVKTLVAAYQMVKSGEKARSHRHTANALRLVLDTGENAFTIVGGKKIPMPEPALCRTRLFSEAAWSILTFYLANENSLSFWNCVIDSNPESVFQKTSPNP